MNETLMVGSTVGMFIVSGLLAWNAWKMRLISKQSVAISVWDHRYNVYKYIMEFINRVEDLDALYKNNNRMIEYFKKLKISEFSNNFTRALLLYPDIEALKYPLIEITSMTSSIIIKLQLNNFNKQEISEEITELIQYTKSNHEKIIENLIKPLKFDI